MPITIPSIGEEFPDLLVETTHGVKRLPHDYHGKWFVFFSHPADFTPVCTTEFISFALRYEEFRRLNTELIGLSVDQSYSHIKWVEWIESTFKIRIPFPIIADPAGKVSQALGLMHLQGGAKTVRAVFIVDPRGVIRAILYYPLELGRNVNEILRLIKAFQVSDELRRAIPSDWPDSDSIGSAVIVPPPSTVAEAEERKAKFKCYDWWFCVDENVRPEDVEEARRLLQIRRPLK